MKTVLDVLDDTIKTLEALQRIDQNNHAFMQLKLERLKADIYYQIREEKSREGQLLDDMAAFYGEPPKPKDCSEVLFDGLNGKRSA